MQIYDQTRSDPNINKLILSYVLKTYLIQMYCHNGRVEEEKNYFYIRVGTKWLNCLHGCYCNSNVIDVLCLLQVMISQRECVII